MDMVGGIPTPLKNMSSSIGMIIPNVWENKTSSKPPTRLVTMFVSVSVCVYLCLGVFLGVCGCMFECILRYFTVYIINISIFWCCIKSYWYHYVDILYTNMKGACRGRHWALPVDGKREMKCFTNSLPPVFSGKYPFSEVSFSTLFQIQCERIDPKGNPKDIQKCFLKWVCHPFFWWWFSMKYTNPMLGAHN